MFPTKALLSLVPLSAVAYGQLVGNVTAETHPTLQWQKCTSAGSCQNVAASVTLDANWRWLHNQTGYTNCYTGSAWDKTLCPDGAACAKNCALEGADYRGVYGISTSGNALTLKFVTKGENTNIGSRVYLMNGDSKYQMFNLLNQEFTFDVDVSKLPCGLNGALYFSEMEEDGGSSKNAANKAGAKYGTGYCDSQCPHDIKFINGAANVEGWVSSPNDTNAGTGKWGACCNEMDIWEANSVSTAYTPHPCTAPGITRCEDCTIADRYGTVCDPDGCDFNSYRQGVKNFYGAGSSNTIDTTKKFTVVTQFITNNNSPSGTLAEIRRLYVQDGKIIQNSQSTHAGTEGDSITDAWCDKQKSVFQDTRSFQNKGGLTNMGKGFQNGMVLVLSIWDDHAANMLWLDSNYPTDADASKPGIARGSCATSSGKPTDVETNSPDATVIYSNIRTGPFGSTYSGTGSNPIPTGPSQPSSTSSPTVSLPPTSTTTSTAPGATQTRFGQCGGTGWTGPTQCPSGSTCVAVAPPYYYQCM